MGKHLTTFMEGNSDTEGSLPYKVVSGLENLEKQRKSLASKVRLLSKRINAKKKQTARDKNHENELADMEREKEALQKLMTTMTGKNVFNFFTDEGLLPNYAFPEGGVVLRSLIWRRRDKSDGAKSKYDTWAYEHERPAGSALAELAPSNRFYAGGRKVEIDQVDMSVSEIETWRLCSSCSYSELIGEHEPQATCRRCGDPAWSDEGQRRQMLRMRQVFASTSDRESRIADDTDDREPSFYNKQLLVDAEPTDIRRAFKVQSDDLPFGFEFLSKATFREINFGEKGDIGHTVSVAGVQTPRKGFTLCRYCGKVQVQKKGKPHIDHALTCTARNPTSDRTVTDCIYLYRDFTSEAIRILLPIAKFGESDRHLHSFVAAIHLGLKKRFGGSIDHLRTALQEEPVPESSLRKQYLVLFDTVPGGTGYLKQLMLDQDQLMEVIEAALDSLQDCSCAKEPDKDGCYRCLFAYRHSYDMKATSRRTAVKLLSSISEHKGKLVETKTLRDISVAALFDSQLEARFIEALRRASTPDRPVKLKADVVDGRPGWFLTMGKRAYTIELHRNMGENDGAPVRCEVDFLFRPIVSRGEGKPICVFTDGFEFHKSRIGLDMAQRSGLLRSGRYHVWSLTWKDVESAFQGETDFYKDFLDPGELAGGAHQTAFIRNYGADPIKAARTQNSFQWLISFLENPEPETCLKNWKSLAFVHSATALDVKTYSDEKARKQWHSDLADHLQFAGILAEDVQPESPDALLGLFEQGGQRTNRTVRLFTSVTTDGLRAVETVKNGDVDAMRVLAFLRDTPKEVERQGFDSIWAGFLRLTNLLQFLPRAAFASQTGLEEGRFAALPPLVLKPSIVPPEPEPDPWEEIRDVVDDDLHELLDALSQRGWPVPDDPPCELVEASQTIAEAELGWTQLKIAVWDTTDERQREGSAHFETRAWQTLSLEGVLEDPQLLFDLHKSGDES
jgi:DEAD/DEAH box helicase domain-containing protein